MAGWDRLGYQTHNVCNGGGYSKDMWLMFNAIYFHGHVSNSHHTASFVLKDDHRCPIPCCLGQHKAVFRQHKVHYSDFIMDAMVFQITSLMIVYSTVYSGAYQENIKALCHWPL